MSASPEFAAQVEALRPHLIAFGRSQPLRNDASAEDAVSVGLRPGYPGLR